MDKLRIKFSCPKHKEDQLMLIKQMRTYMMIYTAMVKAGNLKEAEQYQNAAVHTFDVLETHNKNYLNDATKTYTNQFWKTKKAA